MVRNFIAVMKDSFREAVDGFIIYVMLGLAVLTIVVAASVSYEPEAPDTAFGSTVKRFNQVFQSRGSGNEEVASRIPTPPFGTVIRVPMPITFAASDVQKLDAGKGYAGKYQLRVKVSDEAGERGTFQNPLGKKDKAGDRSLVFPTVVYAWSQPKTPEQYVLISGAAVDGQQVDGKQAEPQFEIVPDGTDPEAALATKRATGARWAVVSTPKVTTAQAGEVTDEMMADFIKNQFLIHGDLDQVEVRRVPTPEKNSYEFEVKATVPQGAKGWPHKTWVLFGAFDLGSGPLGPGVYVIQDYVVNTFGASITLLVAVILTGFFIPNMLRKGSLDLLMAKPMSRWELLLYKYIGGLIFMLIISGLTVGGVWLVMAIRSGNWNPTFLLSILFITFTFAVLYAVSTLVAVLTRSAIAAILITCFFMGGVWLVGWVKSTTDGIRASAFREEDKTGTFYTIIDVTNAVLPRYNDLLKLNSRLLIEGYCTQPLVKTTARAEPPSWFSAGGMSVGYIVVLLGFAYLRFATRDP
jgi:ABC-type transport system involved in multi-copper enzyme maturation permease subunit